MTNSDRDTREARDCERLERQLARSEARFQAALTLLAEMAARQSEFAAYTNFNWNDADRLAFQHAATILRLACQRLLAKGETP